MHWLVPARIMTQIANCTRLSTCVNRYILDTQTYMYMLVLLALVGNLFLGRASLSRQVSSTANPSSLKGNVMSVVWHPINI